MQILALAMAARGLRPVYPERAMRWLHRVAHRRADIGSRRVEVGLVAQMYDNTLDLCCGIVLPAVEAPVYRRLQAVAYGACQRCNRQGGSGDLQVGATGERVKELMQW